MAHTLPPPATEDDKRSKASRKEKKAKKMTGLAIKYSRAIQFYQFTIPTIQLQQPNQERFFLFRRVHDFLLFRSNLFLFILHIFVFSFWYISMCVFVIGNLWYCERILFRRIFTVNTVTRWWTKEEKRNGSQSIKFSFF